MFVDAALEKKFSQLARKYSPRLVFEFGTQRTKGRGFHGIPRKEVASEGDD